MKPAKITHAMLAEGKHVLEVAAHKLGRAQGAFAPRVVFGRGITKADKLIGGFQNAFVTDRGATDVTGQITHDRFARARRLRMHPPAFPPNRVRDLRMQVWREGA